MNLLTETRECLNCARPVKGRTDKKFCDDYCRNHYNNLRKSKSEGSVYVKNINTTLLKNRKTLESLIPEGAQCAKVTREKLHWLGYHFRYFTHTQVDEGGKRIFWCYDFGYSSIAPGWILVVRKNDE